MFKSRQDAGYCLAQKLNKYLWQKDVVVLALPRGGTPVGSEIAKALHLPLEVFVVRKLGVPGQEELAFGAIASGGVCILNEGLVHSLGITDGQIAQIIEIEERELKHREKIYGTKLIREKVKDHTVILVDDGLATGATMKAALRAIRKMRPSKLVVAVPVAAKTTCAELSHEADEIICAETPEPFFSVGQWYKNFPQVTDLEVQKILG